MFGVLPQKELELDSMWKWFKVHCFCRETFLPNSSYTSGCRGRHPFVSNTTVINWCFKKWNIRVDLKSSIWLLRLNVTIHQLRVAFETMTSKRISFAWEFRFQRQDLWLSNHEYLQRPHQHQRNCVQERLTWIFKMWAVSNTIQLC